MTKKKSVRVLKEDKKTKEKLVKEITKVHPKDILINDPLNLGSLKVKKPSLEQIRTVVCCVILMVQSITMLHLFGVI